MCRSEAIKWPIAPFVAGISALKPQTAGDGRGCVNSEALRGSSRESARQAIWEAGFTAASLRRALCTVAPGCGIHRLAQLRVSVLRRKATAGRRVLRGMWWFHPCSEALKCERFLADQRHYPAGAPGPDEVSRNR